MKITFNRIKQIAKEVLTEEYQDFTEEGIRDYMRQTVKGTENSLILQALGIEEGWGKELRIRYSGSFADILKVFQKQTLDKLAKELYNEISEGFEFKLTPKELAHLRKAYRDTYLANAEEVIRELALKEATVDTPKVFQDFMEQE